MSCQSSYINYRFGFFLFHVHVAFKWIKLCLCDAVEVTKEIGSGTGHWTERVPVQRIHHSIAWTKLTDSSSNFGKSLPSLPLRCYCWGWCDMGWKISLVLSAEWCQLCPLPDSCSLSAYSLVQQSCARALQLQVKHWCADNTGLVTKVKSTTLQIVLKKINSLPTTFSTARPQKCLCWVETQWFSGLTPCR